MGIDFTGIFYLAAVGLGFSVGAVLSLILAACGFTSWWLFLPPVACALAAVCWLRSID